MLKTVYRSAFELPLHPLFLVSVGTFLKPAGMPVRFASLVLFKLRTLAFFKLTHCILQANHQEKILTMVVFEKGECCFRSQWTFLFESWLRFKP